MQCSACILKTIYTGTLPILEVKIEIIHEYNVTMIQFTHTTRAGRGEEAALSAGKVWWKLFIIGD